MLLTHWEVETSQVNHRQAALDRTAPSKYYFDPKLGSNNSLRSFFFPFFLEEKGATPRLLTLSFASSLRRQTWSRIRFAFNKAERSDWFNPWASFFFPNDRILCTVTFSEKKSAFVTNSDLPACSCGLNARRYRRRLRYDSSKCRDRYRLLFIPSCRQQKSAPPLGEVTRLLRDQGGRI